MTRLKYGPYICVQFEPASRPSPTGPISRTSSPDSFVSMKPHSKST